MNNWRPFEPSREACTEAAVYAVGLAATRSCNRHRDCDAADAESRRLYPEGRRVGPNWIPPGPAEHCHSDECEECFGS